MTEALLQTHRLKESVAPVLSVLTECARMHRPARKFLKAQVQGWGTGAEPCSQTLATPVQAEGCCLPRCCPHCGT